MPPEQQMPTEQDKSKSIFIYHDDIHLIPFANDLSYPKSPPLPLRRTFSLVRDRRFQTMVYEKTLWTAGVCNEQTCGLRFHSCKTYSELLPKYRDCQLEEKACHKFLFFNTYFSTEDEIEKQTDDDLIAFCIFQKDTISREWEIWDTRLYVTESIIRILKATNEEMEDNAEENGNKEDRYGFGDYSNEIMIAGKTFKLTGNYFAQQNSMTNSCSHAATKMALKGYFPQISAELISEKGGLLKKERSKNKGLKIEKVIQAIRSISNNKANAFYTEPTCFNKPADFLKFVYHAIESRFPVILLYTYPKMDKTKDQFVRKQPGHAVAITGHTFNSHSWWAYGWNNYFSNGGLKNPFVKNFGSGYLSSVLWCDNFIIQDDNLGPHYLLPLQSLKISELPFFFPEGVINAWKKIACLLSKVKSWDWLYTPLGCLIIHPSEINYFEDVLKVERTAFGKLVQCIKDIEKEEILKDDKNFQDYFLPYFKENSLILRTFTQSKEEFCESYQRAGTRVNEIASRILPDNLWITELSIPELFWVNKRKLGEIVIDPVSFHEDQENPVRILRLLNHIVFFDEKDSYWHCELPKDDYMQKHNYTHKLIRPRGSRYFS